MTNVFLPIQLYFIRPVCLPNPNTDEQYESGGFTAAGFGVTHDFFSHFEKLTGLKVPYVEILKEDQVKDLLLAEKVINELKTIF